MVVLKSVLARRKADLGLKASSTDKADERTNNYFMYYNFAQIYSTLKVTPAMQVGIADYVWSIDVSGSDTSFQ
jgi:hypothetical protein